MIKLLDAGITDLLSVNKKSEQYERPIWEALVQERRNNGVEHLGKYHVVDIADYHAPTMDNIKEIVTVIKRISRLRKKNSP